MSGLVADPECSLQPYWTFDAMIGHGEGCGEPTKGGTFSRVKRCSGVDFLLQPMIDIKA